VFFIAAPGTPVFLTSAPPRKKNRGRAGRCRVRAHSSLRERAQTKSAQTHGPRRLATSRLVEADNAASPPIPRRPARGVYRFAPHRPRWTDRFRRPCLSFGLEGRLSTAELTQLVPSTSDRAGCQRRWGLTWRVVSAPGRMRLGPPGREIDAASPTPPNRPPLPAPRLETADPSVARGGMTRTIIHDKKPVNGNM
jgi:hypothetical protein